MRTEHASTPSPTDARSSPSEFSRHPGRSKPEDSKSRTSRYSSSLSVCCDRNATNGLKSCTIRRRRGSSSLLGAGTANGTAELSRPVRQVVTTVFTGCTEGYVGRCGRGRSCRVQGRSLLSGCTAIKRQGRRIDLASRPRVKWSSAGLLYTFDEGSTRHALRFEIGRQRWFLEGVDDFGSRTGHRRVCRSARTETRRRQQSVWQIGGSQTALHHYGITGMGSGTLANLAARLKPGTEKAWDAVSGSRTG